jgi:hypothetical protein
MSGINKLVVKRPMHKLELVWWATSYRVLSEHISPLYNFEKTFGIPDNPYFTNRDLTVFLAACTQEIDTRHQTNYSTSSCFRVA